MRFFCLRRFADFEQPGDEFTESEKQRVVGRKKKKTVSFRFYLPLKKEHRAKNKILGELNILSLSISES